MDEKRTKPKRGVAMKPPPAVSRNSAAANRSYSGVSTESRYEKTTDKQYRGASAGSQDTAEASASKSIPIVVSATVPTETKYVPVTTVASAAEKLASLERYRDDRVNIQEGFPGPSVNMALKLATAICYTRAMFAADSKLTLPVKAPDIGSADPTLVDVYLFTPRNLNVARMLQLKGVPLGNIYVDQSVKQTRYNKFEGGSPSSLNIPRFVKGVRRYAVLYFCLDHGKGKTLDESLTELNSLLVLSRALAEKTTSFGFFFNDFTMRRFWQNEKSYFFFSRDQMQTLAMEYGVPPYGPGAPQWTWEDLVRFCFASTFTWPGKGTKLHAALKDSGVKDPDVHAPLIHVFQTKGLDDVPGVKQNEGKAQSQTAAASVDDGAGGFHIDHPTHRAFFPMFPRRNSLSTVFVCYVPYGVMYAPLYNPQSVLPTMMMGMDMLNEKLRTRVLYASAEKGLEISKLHSSVGSGGLLRRVHQGAGRLYDPREHEDLLTDLTQKLREWLKTNNLEDSDTIRPTSQKALLAASSVWGGATSSQIEVIMSTAESLIAPNGALVTYVVCNAPFAVTVSRKINRASGSLSVYATDIDGTDKGLWESFQNAFRPRTILSIGGSPPQRIIAGNTLEGHNDKLAAGAFNLFLVNLPWFNRIGHKAKDVLSNWPELRQKSIPVLTEFIKSRANGINNKGSNSGAVMITMPARGDAPIYIRRGFGQGDLKRPDAFSRNRKQVLDLRTEDGKIREFQSDSNDKLVEQRSYTSRVIGDLIEEREKGESALWRMLPGEHSNAKEQESEISKCKLQMFLVPMSPFFSVLYVVWRSSTSHEYAWWKKLSDFPAAHGVPTFNVIENSYLGIAYRDKMYSVPKLKLPAYLISGRGRGGYRGRGGQTRGERGGRGRGKGRGE